MTNLPIFQFRIRAGQTPLPEDWRIDLKPAISQSVQTCEELDHFEDINIAKGLIWLEKQGRKNPLIPDFWLKFHKALFKDVWRWAGQYKRRDHANVDFATVADTPFKIAELSADLEVWINTKMPSKEIAARFHERFLTIHPFQNGNGRTSRLLTEYICERQGWPVPTWNQESRKNPKERREDYIRALQEARERRRYEPLIDIIYR